MIEQFRTGLPLSSFTTVKCRLARPAELPFLSLAERPMVSATTSADSSKQRNFMRPIISTQARHCNQLPRISRVAHRYNRNFHGRLLDSLACTSETLQHDLASSHCAARLFAAVVPARGYLVLPR